MYCHLYVLLFFATIFYCDGCGDSPSGADCRSFGRLQKFRLRSAGTSFGTPGECVSFASETGATGVTVTVESSITDFHIP